MHRKNSALHDHDFHEVLVQFCEELDSSQGRIPGDALAAMGSVSGSNVFAALTPAEHLRSVDGFPIYLNGQVHHPYIWYIGSHCALVAVICIGRGIVRWLRSRHERLHSYLIYFTNAAQSPAQGQRNRNGFGQTHTCSCANCTNSPALPT